jgi:hypothetical protein
LHAFLTLLACSRKAPTERLPCSGVWRARAAVRGPAGDAAHSSVDRLSPNRPVPRRQTPLAENLRPTIRTARGWLIHRLFMARRGINCCAWAKN